MFESMNAYKSFKNDDLKLVYRVLHGQLTSHLDLMDSDFLTDLQVYLQGCAQEEGVDVGDHGAWDRWLGGEEVSCESRVERRFVVVRDPPIENG